jgi:hypothetical protein
MGRMALKLGESRLQVKNQIEGSFTASVFAATEEQPIAFLDRRYEEGIAVP